MTKRSRRSRSPRWGACSCGWPNARQSHDHLGRLAALALRRRAS